MLLRAVVELEGNKQMELAVLIVGLLVLGSQIPGNSHIILR